MGQDRVQQLRHSPRTNITFSVRLRAALEHTVLLPDELSGQLDVHVHLADPGEATADVF